MENYKDKKQDFVSKHMITNGKDPIHLQPYVEEAMESKYYGSSKYEASTVFELVSVLD